MMLFCLAYYRKVMWFASLASLVMVITNCLKDLLIWAHSEFAINDVICEFSLQSGIWLWSLFQISSPTKKSVRALLCAFSSSSCFFLFSFLYFLLLLIPHLLLLLPLFILYLIIFFLILLLILPSPPSPYPTLSLFLFLLLLLLPLLLLPILLLLLPLLHIR